jgi:hypothetical protein
VGKEAFKGCEKLDAATKESLKARWPESL